MSDLIPNIDLSKVSSWTAVVSIQGRTDSVVFNILGGTFADGTSQKTVAPNADGKYDLGSMTTTASPAHTTTIASVYYVSDSGWVLVKEASRIATIAQVKELDYRIRVGGFKQLPSGATSQGLYIVGGTTSPDPKSFASGVAAGGLKLSSIPQTSVDTGKSPAIVHDAQAGKAYIVNTANSLAGLTVGYVLSDLPGVKLIRLLERPSVASSGAREFVAFYSDGTIQLYGAGMGIIPIADSTLTDITRVVYRPVSVTSYKESFVAISSRGQVTYLDSKFQVVGTDTSDIFTDASDSYNYLMTRIGTLKGASSGPSGITFYQFLLRSSIALGYDASNNIVRFNLASGSVESTSPILRDSKVPYSTEADWSTDGSILTSGLDTQGDAELFRIQDVTSTSAANPGVCFLYLFSDSGASDVERRTFYAVYRPTSNLAHLAIQDYTSNIPTFDLATSGTSISFSFTVANGDSDMLLPIKLPAGVTWTASVNNKVVSEVRNGDVVTITANHAQALKTGIPFTVGRSSGIVEKQPDTQPDAFSFKDATGINVGDTYKTEDVKITGISVPVPISVLVDGKTDSSVKVYVNGVVSTSLLISNGDTLAIQTTQASNAQTVSVTVGKGKTSYGIYQVAEPVLTSIRNWAYQPVNVKVKSDVITNPGPQAVTITLDAQGTNTVLSNDKTTIDLAAGESTYITFTPTENKKYDLKFSTEQHQYTWSVWCDSAWLDSSPATLRDDRNDMASSDKIDFSSIPENFFVNIKVPAGILLTVNGKVLTGDLDVRGVYKNQSSVLAVEAASSAIYIAGYPSQGNPHTLRLGDASVGWMYNLDPDPVYVSTGGYHVASADVKGFIALSSADKDYVESAYMPAVSNTVDSYSSTMLNLTDILAQSMSRQFDSQGTDYVRQDIQITGAYGTDFTSALFDSRFIGVAGSENSDVLGREYGTALPEVSDVLSRTYGTALPEVSDIFDRTFDSADIFTSQYLSRDFMSAEDSRNSLFNIFTPNYTHRSPSLPIDLPKASVFNTPDATRISTGGAYSKQDVSSIGIDIVADHVSSITQVSLPSSKPDHVSYASSLWLVSRNLVWRHTGRITFKLDISVGNVYHLKAYSQKTNAAFKKYAVPVKSKMSSHNVQLTHGTVDRPAPNYVTYQQPYMVDSNKSYNIVTTYHRIEAKKPEYIHANAASPVDASKSRPIVVTFSYPQKSKDYVKIDAGALLAYADMKMNSFDIMVDPGEKDPLKQGYFASEVEALKNATSVWGYDVSMVYGIQQDNGYWTWAITVLCENICGAHGCDARGYMSGG